MAKYVESIIAKKALDHVMNEQKESQSDSVHSRSFDVVNLTEGKKRGKIVQILESIYYKILGRPEVDDKVLYYIVSEHMEESSDKNVLPRTVIITEDNNRMRIEIRPRRIEREAKKLITKLERNKISEEDKEIVINYLNKIVNEQKKLLKERNINPVSFVSSLFSYIEHTTEEIITEDAFKEFSIFYPVIKLIGEVKKYVKRRREIKAIESSVSTSNDNNSEKINANKKAETSNSNSADKYNKNSYIIDQYRKSLKSKIFRFNLISFINTAIPIVGIAISIAKFATLTTLIPTLFISSSLPLILGTGLIMLAGVTMTAYNSHLYRSIKIETERLKKTRFFEKLGIPFDFEQDEYNVFLTRIVRSIIHAFSHEPKN